MLYNSNIEFGSVTKFFHWSMSILIIIMFAIGYAMTDRPDNLLTTILFLTHKVIGTLILLMAIIRLGWRLTQTKPELLQDIPSWQRYAANINIFLMYSFMIFVPAVGLVMTFLTHGEISQQLAYVHSITSVALLFCAIAYICGSLYQHFICKYSHGNMIDSFKS